MNFLVAIAVVVVSTTAAVVAMLLVRRHAPDGSYFHDGDRAAGVFGVLATGFAVLVCYARSVRGVQWQRMVDGTLGEDRNPWSVKLFETLRTVNPQTPSEQAAYASWLDQRASREVARQDRIHGAVGVIPAPLWVVLFFTSGLIFVYMLFFADSGERAVVQAVMMGTVVSVIVSMLLLLVFLDHPFHEGVGGLRPTAMGRALTVIDQEITTTGHDVAIPCDERGNPT